MRRRLLVLLSPLALLLVVEIVLRCGVWERYAKPDTHAGTSIRLKRALADPSIGRLDFVTLGSSRPEYGFDHAAIATAARAHGATHANLSMPGTHWMTIGVLTRWLAREHPEVRGGVIALSVADFSYLGNGSYELAIDYPFGGLRDPHLSVTHVPFDKNNIESWGTFSALVGWRADFADAARHPFARYNSLRWWNARPVQDILFGNPDAKGDMCAFGLDSLKACDRAEIDAAGEAVGHQCREIRAQAKSRANFAVALEQNTLSAAMQATRDSIRAELRDIRWPTPPLVVLMPTPRLWIDEVAPIGVHAWALSILEPLAREGSIRVIDATSALDRDGHTNCAAYFDFYHQNAVGRAQLMEVLLPQLESALYEAKPKPNQAMIAP